MRKFHKINLEFSENFAKFIGSFAKINEFIFAKFCKFQINFVSAKVLNCSQKIKKFKIISSKVRVSRNLKNAVSQPPVTVITFYNLLDSQLYFFRYYDQQKSKIDNAETYPYRNSRSKNIEVWWTSGHMRCSGLVV